ncbi:MAG TPA: cation-translocating P-type ATPase [Desulfobacterales bacterium]|nr:cation-translocating P-type ATPase [Desulfobacterales bacterium]
MIPIHPQEFEVCHSIPGRLRVKLPSTLRCETHFRHLEKWLSRKGSLQRVEVRRSTGSVILVYDPEEMQPHTLMDLLGQGLNWQAINSPQNGPQRAYPESSQEGRHGNAPRTWAGHLLNVVALTAFMGYIFIKRVLLKSPISQRPASAVGIAATLGSISMLRRTLADLRQRKGGGLFPFLTAACGFAILSGQALTALEIIWVLSVGMLLEEYVADRARRSIRDILEVSPDNTLVLADGVEVKTPVAQVKVGDQLVIRSGKKIPVDGLVVRGEAVVDEALITGRWQPELRKPDHWVYAGTVVRQGTLFLRAEKLGDQTYLRRIIRLVETSLASRSETERKADLLAIRLMRFGMAATLGTLVLTRDLARSLAVMLVMSCPCATVLAASTAITAAIASAARRQILVKGGLHLEQASIVDVICFDKTGTVTTDVPKVIEIRPRAPRQDPSQILELAATAESKDNHPIAKALVDSARRQGVVPSGDITCKVFLGQGIRAKRGSETILVGSGPFFDREGVNRSYFRQRAQTHMEAGHTVLYVARNGKLQGLIAVSSDVRSGSEAVLECLRKEHATRLCLISSDTEPVVRTFSEMLGFDDYEANLLPEQKAQYIEDLETRGHRVLMIGDGVNDALALSKATVGVAMGAGGSEAAVEACDIALLGTDLKGLVILRQLSRQTLQVIEQNFWIANLTNIIGVFLGLSGWAPLLASGALHMGHTLGILANSSRLINWKPRSWVRN